MRSVRILCWILLLIPFQSSAYTVKEGNISASLGPFIYQTNYESGPGRPKSPLMGDMALLVQGDVNERSSLEISLFHMNKVFFRDHGGSFIEEQLELMQVGLGYRVWVNHYVSVAWALYSSYAMGDYKTVHYEQSPGNDIDTSARDITEYGMDFSLQAEVWSQDRLAVIMDARYGRSLTSKPNEHGDHYGMLVALRYFIQSRDPH